jgi:ribosomal-protein-serine acetyltransferase
MNPLLRNLPTRITAPDLMLRAPQEGDGILLNAAILNSFEQLKLYMTWATEKPTVEKSELFCRQTLAQWTLRLELTFLIFDHEEHIVLGAVSLHTIDWLVPRFELGYWVNSQYANRGIATQAVLAVTHYAFKELKALRVEIRCDEDNVASRKVAQKLGFIKEGILRNHTLKPHGHGIRNTVIYACYSLEQLPPTTAHW